MFPPSSPPKQFLILLCLLIFSVTFTKSTELEILLKFKSSFENPNSTVFESWTPHASPCSFTGISCNSEHSITQISLPNKHLSGFLLLDLICQLPLLEKLDMSSNLMFGTISDALTKCTKLSHLDLSQNYFIGSIPDCSSLINLSFLNLKANGFSGVFPWKSLENLTFLQFLNLGDDQFEGSIPPEIEHLLGLSGPIPAEISNFLISLIGLPVLVICFGSFLLFKKRRNDKIRSMNSGSWDLKSFSRLEFTESKQDILNAIYEENLIGAGGSGNVYRVDLADGNKLAVKRIWKSDSSSGRKNNRSTSMGNNGPGILSELDTKVEALSSIRHVNVNDMYRSFTSKDSIMFVSEYMPNGSLWDRLHTCNQKTVLDWQTRYDIAVGSAKGLEYLHYGCDKPVIHGAVKSSNILLGEFFKPKIADFGLANLVLQAENASARGSTAHFIAGSQGYVAPENASTCGFKVSEKSDVYSFGVVLMELVTGKKPIHEPEFGENEDIVQWIYAKMNSGESVLGMVDTAIPGALQEQVVKVLRVAVLCSARLPAQRPSMTKVVQMLEDAEPFKLVSITMPRSCIIGKDEMKTKRQKY